MGKNKKSKKMTGGSSTPAGRTTPPAAPAGSCSPQVTACPAMVVSDGILMGDGTGAPIPDSARVDSVNPSAGQTVNPGQRRFIPGQRENFKKIGINGQKSIHDDGTSASTWSSLFKDNRSSSSGASLTKVTDGITKDKIIFHASEFADDCHVARSLIGFFSPKFPGFDALISLTATWKHKCTVARHTASLIVFTFPTKEEAWSVLEGGPYTSFGSILHLREMPKFFNFAREKQRAIPVWVQLHNLPLELWRPKHLAKLCSFIGRPLHTDQLTLKMERISFARCLIEIDVDAVLPSHLTIDLPDGSTLSQSVLYEHKPLYCEKCKRLGHASSTCRDTGEPTLYVMRKPMNKVVKPTVVKKMKNVNPASAPTDVWVEVGRKKTGDLVSVAETPSGAVLTLDKIEASVSPVEISPPPGFDKVTRVDMEEDIAESSDDSVDDSDEELSDDECAIGDDPDPGDRVGMGEAKLVVHSPLATPTPTPFRSPPLVLRGEKDPPSVIPDGYTLHQGYSRWALLPTPVPDAPPARTTRSRVKK